MNVNECHAFKIFLNFYGTQHHRFRREVHLFLVSAHTQPGRVAESAPAAVVLP